MTVSCTLASAPARMTRMSERSGRLIRSVLPTGAGSGTACTSAIAVFLLAAERVDGLTHGREDLHRLIDAAYDEEVADLADVVRDRERDAVAREVVGGLDEHADCGDIDEGHGFSIEHDRARAVLCGVGPY